MKVCHKGIESLSQTHIFLSLYLCNLMCRPLIFQTIISVRLNNLSLKNRRFTPLSCKNIVIRKCNIVTKTQFLCLTCKNWNFEPKNIRKTCFRYFVEGSTDILYERWFHCEDLGTQLKPIIGDFLTFLYVQLFNQGFVKIFQGKTYYKPKVKKKIIKTITQRCFDYYGMSYKFYKQLINSFFPQHCRYFLIFVILILDIYLAVYNACFQRRKIEPLPHS